MYQIGTTNPLLIVEFLLLYIYDSKILYTRKQCEQAEIVDRDHTVRWNKMSGQQRTASAKPLFLGDFAHPFLLVFGPRDLTVWQLLMKFWKGI